MFAESEYAWHNITCPALLFIAVVMLSKHLACIKATLDGMIETLKRMPPPAQTPYVPPVPPPPRSTSGTP